MVSEQQVTQLVDPHVFLSGRPPMGQFLAFVKAEAVDPDSADGGSLADDWRAANDHIRELEESESGIADGVSVQPLDEALAPLVEELRNDPIFQESFKLVPADVGLVELDRLVVFQKQINLRFVEELRERLGPTPTDEDVFRFCLPFDHPTPNVNAMRVNQNTFAFVSPSTDLRVLDIDMFPGDSLTSYKPSGPAAGLIGLVVGFGSNFLNAVSAEGRLILNNGSHRAYALRDSGITHAPCIVQRVSRREELEAGFPQIHANPSLYLESQRPPVLKDYFDARLRKIVQVPRKLRQIRVAVQVEQADSPAM